MTRAALRAARLARAPTARRRWVQAQRTSDAAQFTHSAAKAAWEVAEVHAANLRAAHARGERAAVCVQEAVDLAEKASIVFRESECAALRASDLVDMIEDTSSDDSED